jgi:hypothetical protein
MNFPLEMEKVSQRRTKVVSIRQSSQALASNTGPFSNAVRLIHADNDIF